MFRIVTGSFETAIIVKAFESWLLRDGRVKDLVAVMVVVVVGGSGFTHLLLSKKPALVYKFSFT